MQTHTRTQTPIEKKVKFSTRTGKSWEVITLTNKKKVQKLKINDLLDP